MEWSPSTNKGCKFARYQSTFQGVMGGVCERLPSAKRWTCRARVGVERHISRRSKKLKKDQMRSILIERSF